MEPTEEIGHQSNTSMPGRSWVIASLVCAGLALAVKPVMFGPLGIVAGAVAAWKGATWWASAAVAASLGEAVASGYLVAYLAAGLSG